MRLFISDWLDSGTWECLGEGTIEEQNEMWDDGEPDSADGNEDCAAVIASGLHDVKCYRSEKLICQRPVAPALLLLWKVAQYSGQTTFSDDYTAMLP